MKSPLADPERETIIVWSEADDGCAHVYTCQPPMIRLLRRHPHARLVEEHRSEKGELTRVDYELPVACLAIFSRPRASAWERMMRSGPRRRSSRRHLSKTVQTASNGEGNS